MGIVYSLYDALVSIKVPDEKAKAVIDALEREMMDKLATKADVTHAKEVLSKDISALQVATKADIKHLHESLSRDVQAVQVASKADLKHLHESLSKDVQSSQLASKADLSHFQESVSKDIRNLSSTMTIKLGSLSVLGVGVLYWLLKAT